MKLRRKVAVICAAGILFALTSYTMLPPVRGSVDHTYDQLKMLIDVMTLIRDNYVEPRDNKELLNGAITGMVHTLDPFSQFMEPKVYKDMKTETEGEFGGIGIRISSKNDILTVITPIPGTPAYRAGILPDDKILKVNGKSTQNVALEDAVELMRGAPGTKVVITVLHEGAKETVDFTLVREIIKIETIRGRMLDSEIGYIQLSEFSANSDKDLRKMMDGLTKEGMKSMVFDLRNNPGGLLDVAVDVCKEFIGDGKLVVYTQGREKESRRNYMAQGKAPYGKLPLVVLVNRGSASASEIVSGAMQDLKRGLIVGTTTFGKGSVQSVLPLGDGYGLRLTTAKYYTPAGRSIHRDEKTGKGGIIPDMIIEVPRDVEGKLYSQSEILFAKGKDAVSAVKDKDRVEDVVLDKAVQVLKTRKMISSLKEE